MAEANTPLNLSIWETLLHNSEEMQHGDKCPMHIASPLSSSFFLRNTAIQTALRKYLNVLKPVPNTRPSLPDLKCAFVVLRLVDQSGICLINDE